MERESPESRRLSADDSHASRLLELLGSHLGEAILVLGPDLTVRFASERLRERLAPATIGPSADSLLDTVHPEDRERVRRAFAAKPGSHVRVGARVKGVDGEWVWAEMALTLIQVEGEGTYRVVLTRDATAEAERAEELQRRDDELRESEERYRVLVESAPEGIIVHARGEILYANPAAARMVGVESPRELIGSPVADLLHQEAIPAAEQQIELLRREPGAGHTLEWTLVRRDGTEREMLGSGGIIQYHGRAAVQGVMRDITELKRIQRERERLRERLEQAQKLESLGVLAGGIAHDFNNLLMVIMGNVELLSDAASLGEEERSALADSLRAAETASTLTRQLLTYAGKRPSETRPVDLHAQVHDLGGVLRAAVPRKVDLEFELGRDLPAVEADGAQLQQVLMNLVLNAAEAVGDAPGRVRVCTRAAWLSAEETRVMIGGEEIPEGEYVVLEVSDTGCGMDSDTQRRLFDPFFTTKATGHGLGLSAVLGVVRGHSGGIRVTSRPGQGTTIAVYLPTCAASADERHEIIEADLAGRGHVLVVDDEAAVCRVLHRILADAGYQVSEVHHARDVLEAAERIGDDLALAIIDLHMPEMSGDEVLQALRARRPQLPVIISTGYDDRDLGRRLRGLPRTGFMAKPFGRGELLGHVRRLLSQTREG